MKLRHNGWLIWPLIFIQASCATVVSGKSQDVHIRSKPSGADVKIDGIERGATPLIASLARKKRHTIEITRTGCSPVIQATRRGFNWWYLGNLILGGVIGLIVDPITGAIFEVSPDEINADLSKEGCGTAH